MLINKLEATVYPECGRWFSELTENPTWRQIEDAIRKLDCHRHPFLHLFLDEPEVEAEIEMLNIIGGQGEYGISLMANFREIRYFDQSRPDGPDLVPIWTTDQGAEFTERYLCNDLATVFRIAKYFASTGTLDPLANWEDRRKEKFLFPQRNEADFCGQSAISINQPQKENAQSEKEPPVTDMDIPF